MKYINAVRIFALLVVLIFSAGISSAAPDLKSSKPRYASILLPDPHAKAITVIFDESRGTGKGYDTIYVDVNMDGKFEPAEKKVDGAKESDDILFHMFPTFNIPSQSAKSKKSHSLSFDSIKLKKEEHFGVSVYTTFKGVNKGSDLFYLLSDELKPSTNPKKPFVWSFGQSPVVKIDSKPDRSNTGIAVSLHAGTASISSPSAKVDLTIKNKNGKVVKKETGNLDKFAFG